MVLCGVEAEAVLQCAGERGVQCREVGVQSEADLHVAHLHLDFFEHVAVLEVLEVLNAHVQGREVAQHAQGMVRRELGVTERPEFDC